MDIELRGIPIMENFGSFVVPNSRALLLTLETTAKDSPSDYLHDGRVLLLRKSYWRLDSAKKCDTLENFECRLFESDRMPGVLQLLLLASARQKRRKESLFCVEVSKSEINRLK